MYEDAARATFKDTNGNYRVLDFDNQLDIDPDKFEKYVESLILKTN